MNLYNVGYYSKSFSIYTTFEAKNKTHALSLGVDRLSSDRHVPDCIKNKINKSTVVVERIYKSRRATKSS